MPKLVAEAANLNAEYVAERVFEFVERQALKAALVEATDRYGRDDETMVADIKTILTKAVNIREDRKETRIMPIHEFSRRRWTSPRCSDAVAGGQSTTMLHGPAGACKTLAMMQVAVSLDLHQLLQRQMAPDPAGADAVRRWRTVAWAA